MTDARPYVATRKARTMILKRSYFFSRGRKYYHKGWSYNHYDEPTDSLNRTYPYYLKAWMKGYRFLKFG